MKRKRYPFIERLHAASSKDFNARVREPLDKLGYLLTSLNDSDRESITMRLPHEYLIMSLPSICYALPFPFLLLNAERKENMLSVGWHIEDSARRRELKWMSFGPCPEACHYVFLGYCMDQLEGLQPGQFHVCLKAWAPEGTITTCQAEPITYLEAFQKFWKPFEPIDHFVQRTSQALQTVKQALVIEEAAYWP